MPHKRNALFLALALFAFPSLAAITGSVMTPEGKPVAGARVSTYAFESNDARRARLLSEQPEAVPLASTQTDAKGAFSLESPKNAVVTLRAYLRGYDPMERTIERDEEGAVFIAQKTESRTGAITAGGKPVADATVVLSYGGAELIVKTNDEGRFEAPDSKRLGGITVLHRDYAVDDDSFYSLTDKDRRAKLNRTLTKGTALTGRVLAADGKTPAAKAAITLNGWPVATSGDDGSFTIEHAPAKWETLIARKDGLIAQRAFAKDVSTTLKLEKATTFAGRITDAKTKLPVVGAIVALGGRRPGRTADIAPSMEVDAKGAYSFVAPAGSYNLMVSHPGYEGDLGEIAAAAGDRGSRDFALQPLARITGVVVDEARKPVAAASVSGEITADPMSMRLAPGRMMTMMRDAQSTATGPDGKFLLRVTGDRDLRVRAAKKGLPTGRSDSLKLAHGERKSGVVVTLPSGIEVTGRIVDADDNPVSGVSVSAAETQGRNANTMQRMMITIGGPNRGDDEAVQTSSDGTFSMRLKEGAYDFTARRDGYASKTVRAHAVAPSGTLPVELKLDPAVEITGRIARGGTGVEGVNINVFGGGNTSNAISGPDGSFTLGNLTAGQVSVFLNKADEFISEQRMLTAPARDVAIDLQPGVRVSGRVVEKGSSRPITSFEAGVTRSRSGGPMMMMGPPQTKAFTSDDGSFVLENVPTGSATLVANAPGFVSGRLNLTIEEGKPVTDVVLELDTGVKLTGKVTSPTGAALPDVTVSLAPSPNGNFALSGGEKRATTDSNGEYTLDALTTGDETISFRHAKYLATSKQVTLKGKEMRLDVQLEGGTRFSGLVVTEAGVPVAEASVRASAPGSALTTATTNANGVFEFESLAPGRYRFTAQHGGYADGVLEDFDIATGGQARIVLKTGGTIYGRVTGVSEQELAQTFVMARSGSNMSQTPVDATGSYRIEGAPVGNVQVSASVRNMTENRSTATQMVTVSAGSSMQVDLAFRSDVVVRGRVTRNGAPLVNASVMFSSRGGTASSGTSSASTDGNSYYSIAGLEDGNYLVNVIEMQRMSTYSTNFEVRGSSTFDIDYTTASMRGRVVDAGNSRPISGANVSLRANSTVEMFRGRGATTDENGVWVIDNVPAGSYTVSASLDSYGSVSKDVVVGESTLDNVELRLSASDGVTFNVVDARDGRALRANAALYDMSGRLMPGSDTGFIFGDQASGPIKVAVAPGQYIATVSTQNYAPVHVTVNAPSTRTIALSPGGRIEIESKHSDRQRVQLLDAFNIPYPRFGPMPRRYDIFPRAITPLERIAPGRYTLQLLGADDVTVIDQVQVIVTEGQTAKAEI